MMEMFNTSLVSKDSRELGYWIQESNSKSLLEKLSSWLLTHELRKDPTYFPGRSADIYLRYLDPTTCERKTIVIGSFGVLHPTVLENFELTHPTTVLEYNLEPFL